MATTKTFTDKQFTKQQVGELTMKELVQLHNQLVGKEGSKSAFKDKSEAVNTVWGLGTEVAEVAPAATGEKPAKAAKAPKAPKEPKPPKEPKVKAEVFEFDIAADIDRKMCATGTGTEALAVVLARPEGATFQECVDAVSTTKDHTATRNDIVGGIRWLNKGMGYGIMADERGAMHLCDADRVKVGYVAREVESVEAKEARKAAKEAEKETIRVAKAAEKLAKKEAKAAEKAAKDAAKAAEQPVPVPAN